MTATQTRIRRGTAAQIDSMTPAADEVVSDTTNKRLRVGDGVTTGGIHLPNAKDLQDQTMVYGVAGGTADDLVVALSPPIASLNDGTTVKVKAGASNTGPATLDVDGLGPVAIQKFSGTTLTDLTGGELFAGNYYTLTFNGAVFILNATAGIEHFESAPINYVGAGHYSATHGKSSVPILFSAVLRCVTADSSFAPGDEVPVYQNVHASVGNYTAYANATRIGLRTTNNIIFTPPTGSPIALTLARWKVVLRGVFAN